MRVLIFSQSGGGEDEGGGEQGLIDGIEKIRQSVYTQIFEWHCKQETKLLN
jgi:hypothetical protein